VTDTARFSLWPNRPLIMGIVNVTPDSFSDGGEFFRWEKAVEHGLTLASQGADMLDIGGESTRPGSEPITPEDELERVLPVIRALTGELDIPLSIDTRRAIVAAAALDTGASWVNDVSALSDPAMAEAVARFEGGIILMHMKGEPATMQRQPHYDNVVEEVRQFLEIQSAIASAAGIERDRIWVDPGIGFGKSLHHNLQLLAGLDRIAALGYPVVLGASRKGFVGTLSGAGVNDRLAGSLAAAGLCLGLRRSIIRVHDVAATKQYLSVRRSLEIGVPLPWEPGTLESSHSRKDRQGEG